MDAEEIARILSLASEEDKKKILLQIEEISFLERLMKKANDKQTLKAINDIHDKVGDELMTCLLSLREQAKDFKIISTQA
jgi:hypothetical protein